MAESRFSGMSDDEVASRYMDAAERATKWRKFFAGWQLGTRPDSDPEAAAVRNTSELLIILRAELNTLTCLLMEAQVFTPRRFTEQLIEEFEALEQAYEKAYPGIRATPDGLHMDIPAAAETMKRMNFKP